MMQSSSLRKEKEVLGNIFGLPDEGVVMMGTINYSEDKNPFLPVILGREQDTIVLPHELQGIYVPWAKHLVRNGLGKSRVVFAKGHGNLAQRLYDSENREIVYDVNNDAGIVSFDNGDLTFYLQNNGYNLLDLNDETSKFVDGDPDMVVYAVQNGVREGLGKKLQGVKVRTANTAYRDWPAKVHHSLEEYFSELENYDPFNSNGEGLVMVNPYQIANPDESNCVVYEYVSLRRPGQNHFPNYLLDRLHRRASIHEVK